jgi:hypothetical protein
MSSSEPSANFQHERFGTFTFDSSMERFEASTHWAGGPVTLVIRTEDDRAAALDTAGRLWDAEATWDRRNRECAVAELLETWREAWSEDAEPETAESFAAKMVPRTVIVGTDGSFEFWHNDSDLFGGHSIVVTGTIAEGPQRADIEG